LKIFDQQEIIYAVPLIVKMLTDPYGVHNCYRVRGQEFSTLDEIVVLNIIMKFFNMNSYLNFGALAMNWEVFGVDDEERGKYDLIPKM
jgi:hypothetical protein